MKTCMSNNCGTYRQINEGRLASLLNNGRLLPVLEFVMVVCNANQLAI
jgi:hypothetical protein